ncbi:nuclease-related domain-containing DEAD/DEAH box helicase [Streptomyces platensis]|uniref:nuclease-related domain-containing DEAD/DEAH box helicase n=1 Tax=Streptomyces platensis TaxID=58346 RepID=UPI001F29DAB7|nr:UvrD-helicase domain-containing protein [Streptomyces platensis]MCF3147173.1 UvrD-helicase domain-containing protein [Streptomyces platensis]
MAAGSAPGGSAGASAARRAQQARRQERLLREQWQAARARAERWEAASEGERRVAAQLLMLAERGWRLLVDRRWPGTRAANVDMLLIGPGGVFVIDVKNWRAAPEASAGRLRAGGFSRDEHRRKLLAVTKAAESAVASLGMSPVAVRPLLAFAGHRVDAELGRVRLLGEREIGPALLSERTRLSAESVRALTEHLERVFPEYEAPSTATPDAFTSDTAVPDTASRIPDAASDGLFDLDGLRDAALDEARRAPIERWMTFLDPDQLALVRRNWAGPARISGPAGTGKTVIALHRAAYLAQRTNGRVLYVTFANNLPRVQATFLKAMAPAVADRVDFRSLHSWAQDHLRDRGVPVHLHKEKAETAFSFAWKHVGRNSCLTEIDPLHPYWREEIDYVIKGRGITSFEEYAALPRRRRRAGLRRPHRQAVWSLYQAYEAQRTERAVHDFNDVLSLALAEAAGRIGHSAYTAVVVDEVQDLTLVGVRLLHALVGDTPNGLLLVGDGQQAVYPGGFRLSDAGIDIRGDRGQVLRANYRNSKEIVDTALSVVAEDAFEDLDGLRTPGRRDIDLTYHDGEVQRAVLPTPAAHDEALLTALRGLTPQELAGSAVLCPAKRAIEHYQRLLTRAGLRVCSLDRYDGHPVEAVKLGSYRRAKGLEFKRVYLPQHDTPPPTGTPDGRTPAETADERAELARSQLYVAMTRARDVLWLGSVRPVREN